MDEAAAARLVAKRRAMAKVQKLCDEQDLPYPPELIAWLTDLHQPAYKRKRKPDGR